MAMNNKFRDVITKIMESATLDEKGELKVLDENTMKEADAALEDIIVEAGRKWWAQLEAVEDDLGDMEDEITFDEVSADPSSIDSGDIPVDDDEEFDTVESILGGDDFDLNSIFEDDDDDISDSPVDGDEEFDDMRMGLDDNGIGDDGDLDVTDNDDDLDVVGDDEEDDLDLGLGDDESDLETDDDLGDDDLGDDLGGDDFDLSVLDDVDGLDGEVGSDDLGDDLGDDEFSDDDFAADEDEFADERV